MQSLLISALLVSAAAAVAPPGNLPLVQSDQLRRVLTQKALKTHGRMFMEFAAVLPDKTRAFGSVGHNRTVSYIKKQLDATGYYDTVLQNFVHLYSTGAAEFSAGGKKYDAGSFTYGPSGNVTARVVNVAAVGCEPANFPPEVAGNIALISRGTCEFGLKVAYAGAAGASGVIIYNNIPGVLSGTLSQPSRPQGPYVPVASLSNENGTALATAAAARKITGTLGVVATTENRTTTNVIATTKRGDKNNIVCAGAHTDSVPQGPGLNDNGSGSIGLLEIALQLPMWSVSNAVCFAFWSAEEFGLVGSRYYVNNLTPAEREKIAVYLNVDMIASPNYGYFIYDGDGSAFNLSGPAGSAHIEKLYEDYFRDDVGLSSRPTAFTGRSDYGPFLDVGIPCGGLFTGAEQIKTVEEEALFGGKAGVAYDINYHKPSDTLTNCNMIAWIQNTKALAHSIAYYARNLTGIPRGAPRRGVKVEKSDAHGGGCGGHGGSDVA